MYENGICFWKQPGFILMYQKYYKVSARGLWYFSKVRPEVFFLLWQKQVFSEVTDIIDSCRIAELEDFLLSVKDIEFII